MSGTLVFSGYIQRELKEESRETLRNVSNRKRVHTLNEDTTDSQSPAPGGYVSFVAHIWVGDDGKLIRGTIEDAHSGTRLALDLSEVIAFLQGSLAHSPGPAGSQLDQGVKDKNEQRQRERFGEGPPDATIQEESIQPPKEDKG